MNAEKIRVFVADDHALFRTGLRLLVGAQPDMEVVGEASDGASTVERLKTTEADVLLLDLSMPEGGGLYALRLVREHCPRVRTIVLTMHDDRAHLRGSMQAGASGYVTKSAADSDLLAAIRAVRRGRVYVDPAVQDDESQSGAQDQTGEPGQRTRNLSLREREVLILVATGHTNREIAAQLGVSIKTIETYRMRLLDKLGLKTRAELVRYAMNMGLLASKSS